MGIFSRNKPEAVEPVAMSATPPEILPPARSNAPMSVESAMSLIPVYSSIRLISNACSQLPMAVTRDGAEIKTPKVIEQPDRDRSRRDWTKRAVTNLLTTGNLFLLVQRNPGGDPVNVRVLAPSSVQIRFDENNFNKLFDVTFSDGKTYTYTPENVKHVRLMELENSNYGIGPLQAARVALMGHREIRDFSASWLRDGGVPQGVITTDFQTDADSTAAIQEAWYTALDNRSTMVLPPGWKYSQISVDAASVQWLESMNYGVADVARLFSIPPVKLLASVESSSLTYSNINDLNRAWVSDCLLEYLGAIEDALSDVLRGRQMVKFQLDEFLRADEKVRYDTYAVGINAGFLNVDDVRKKEGLPPLPKEPEAPAPAVEPPKEDLPVKESDPVEE